MTYIEQRLETLERIVTELQSRIDELETSVLPERRIVASIEAAPESISMVEAARLAGVHRNTVYGWVRDGKLPAVKSGRERLVKRTDLLALVEAES